MIPSPSLPWFELARFRRSRLTRAAVIAVTKQAKPSAPTASLVPCPSTSAIASHSLAVPSVNAKHRTSRPMSRVRGSRQACPARSPAGASASCGATGR